MVLFGARAFAIPLRFGQSLDVYEVPGNAVLHWETTIQDRFWFTMEMHIDTFKVKYTSDAIIAEKLVNLLQRARDLNPQFLSGSIGLVAKSNINFNIYWGMGSSSSLISNIAEWAHIDPFVLNNQVSKGSGYDIACARSHHPIVFWLDRNEPHYFDSHFNPSYIDKLYFVYLGRKQDTNASIEDLLKYYTPAKSLINQISQLTETMRLAGTIEEFNECIRNHEQILSNVLHQPPVKDQYFSDFNGDIKSLGAWGGDFILATSKESEESLVDYFKKKDLYTIFPYSEIAISNGSV